MSADLTFTAAMVQMRTGLLSGHSLEQGTKLIREAAAQGADYVLTPEVSNMMQVNRKALFEHFASEEDDLSLKAYRALAAELKIYLHIGSLALRASAERAVNRSFLIGPDGNVIASYDKIHMFDIDLGGGESYHESANYQPGETAVLADLPWGRIGLTICYDVRFPALYRALAEGGATETGVFLAKIDPAKVETARKTVPSLQHGRRFGVADPKAGPEHLHLVRGSA